MEIIFMPIAVADREYWKKSGNIIIQKRITQILEAIHRDPYKGIGKPERLKHNFSEWWSRRINDEHRVVYKCEQNKIYVYSLRYHYQK